MADTLAYDFPDNFSDVKVACWGPYWLNPLVSLMDIVYHKSTDGMATWGAEQAYGESTDDHRLVHAGRTVGFGGGRFQPAFYDDDQVDIYINEVNDVEIESLPIVEVSGPAIVQTPGKTIAL